MCSAQPIDIGMTFELVICLEMIDHVPAESEDMVLKTLACHAKNLILFSSAQVGQPGRGHINIRPFEYWMAKWAALGWRPLGPDSLGFRALATLSWLQRNPVLLAREPANDQDGTDLLARISRHKWRWLGDSPGVISVPFKTIPRATLGENLRAWSVSGLAMLRHSPLVRKGVR